MIAVAGEAGAESVPVPSYLTETYWWAYVHPKALGIFDRPWLINTILWGNYARLRDAALDALGDPLDGRTLQVGCVYGDLTARLAERVAPGASLDVADVLSVQLEHLRAKLSKGAPVYPRLMNSAALNATDASYDRSLCFFLLHEQPEEVRRATLREALRVTRPGGRIVLVDYHRPRALHPLRPAILAVLSSLEPFALDLWRAEIETWLPKDIPVRALAKRFFFGGLYQLVIIER